MNLSLRCTIDVKIGELKRTVEKETSVDLAGRSLSSIEEALGVANVIETTLLQLRRDVFHNAFQVILTMVSLLLRGVTGVDCGSSEDRTENRGVRLESLLGRVFIPVHGIPLEKLGLRRILYTAEVLKNLAHSVIAQSVRNTTDDFNRQQQRTGDEELKYRSVSNTMVDLGMSAFSSFKSAAYEKISQYVTWVDKKDKLFPVITWEVAIAQGWVYEPCSDPEILCQHEELVLKTAQAINEKTRKRMIESKKKKDGEKFDLSKYETTLSRRMIQTDNLARSIERPDEKVVYIMIDGILSHLQKEKRRTPESKRRWTNNNVAYVEVDGCRHVLVAKELQDLFVFILTLLIENDLLDRRMIFFVDGAVEINDAIETCFGFTEYSIFLDYYHASNKVYELTSMWVRGSKKRKESIRATLRAYIWTGRVDCVLSYLDTFLKIKGAKTDEDIEKNPEIANAKKYKELVGYFTRKGNYIPCYALRKELGLVNSSNCVEQTNNVMIAARQKNNGMSWSKDGSLGIAVLTMLKRNGALDSYIETGKVSFKFAGVKVGGKRAKAIRDWLATAA